MSATYLIGSCLPLDVLQIIEGFLIAYQYRKHSWTYLCEVGEINGLKWLRKNHIGHPTISAFHCAVEMGHLHVLKWLLKHYPNLLIPNNSELRLTQNVMLAIQIAASQNHFEIMKWIVEEFNSFIKVEKSLAMSYAVEVGNLEMVQWLHEKNFPSSYRCIDEAAVNGHLHILQWYAHAIPNLSRSRDVIRFVAENGHLHILQWILSLDPIAEIREQCINTSIIDYAAGNGFLEIVQWMHDSLDLFTARCCTVLAMDLAAANGHLEMVKWLHSHRTEGCSTFAIDHAAANGHLEVIQWLHFHRTEGCTSDAMDSAVEKGHFEVVQWLHDNRTEGCTSRAFDSAAENGHLDILRWLYANFQERSCSEMAIVWAAQNKHFQICRWLIEGNQSDWSVEFLLSLAAANGFELILWCPDLEGILSSKENREQFMCEIAYVGNLDIFQWLFLNHRNIFSSLGERCIFIAIGRGHILILEFLFKFWQIPTSIHDCFIRAIISNQLEALEWLCVNFKGQFKISYDQLLTVGCERGFMKHWLRKIAPKYFSSYN